jgi:hypothetical protein
LAKCRDTGELIAVGTAYKMLKGSGLVISSDTPDNPLNDRSKQIARRLTGSIKDDMGIDPLRLGNSWGDLRGMPRDITGDLAASDAQSCLPGPKDQHYADCDLQRFDYSRDLRQTKWGSKLRQLGDVRRDPSCLRVFCTSPPVGVPHGRQDWSC